MEKKMKLHRNFIIHASKWQKVGFISQGLAITINFIKWIPKIEHNLNSHHTSAGKKHSSIWMHAIYRHKLFSVMLSCQDSWNLKSKKVLKQLDRSISQNFGGPQILFHFIYNPSLAKLNYWTHLTWFSCIDFPTKHGEWITHMLKLLTDKDVASSQFSKLHSRKQV